MRARRISLMVLALLLAGFIASLVGIAGGASTIEELESRVEALEALHGITTTTTQVPFTTSTSTPTPGDGLGFEAVAAIGCSNTDDEVRGYLRLSSEDNLINVAQGGVEIWEWATQESRWTKYENLRPSGGYDAIWINLCQKARSGPIDSEHVHDIVVRAGQSDPDIPVYISPLNYYEEGLCPKNNGNQVPDQGFDLMNNMPYNHGPLLGPLGPEHVTSDLCHPSDEGEELVGAQLIAFFDG